MNSIMLKHTNETNMGNADMEIKCLKNEQLLREYEVTMSSADAVKEAESNLTKMAETYEMAGFRPGKVPLNIVRKRVYPDLLGDAIKKEANRALEEVIKQEKIMPAPTPMVELQAFDEKGSMVVHIKMEIFPDVPEVAWENITVDNLQINLGDDDLKEAHKDILKNFRNYDKAAAEYAAQLNDAVLIDFVGKCDEKEFEGGSGKDVRLVLGSQTFVPGFEEQLVGAKAGESRQVNVTIPENYPAAHIAGKAASFAVTVQEVLLPEDVNDIDDEFAKKLGLQDLEQLNKMILDKVSMDFQSLARLRMKKMLFDQVDEHYRFNVPESMIKIDFDAMWREVEAQYKRDTKMFGDKSLDEVKSEYQQIAARRVRVGIILANVARQNQLTITDEDCKQAIMLEAMRRPGQEQMVFDFYKKEENIERLKGPILEEKAVDFILTKVKTNDISITSKEFFANYAKDLNGGAAAA